MSTKWEIVQEVKVLPKLSNPVFIEGLPGIGNVGKITADFFVEELKAVKLYSFFSHKFPHSVFVNEDNLIDEPKIELYYKKFTPQSGKRDLLILVGDIQPIDEEGCYTFCEEILRIVQQFGGSHVIALGGIGLQETPKEPKVFCTANDLALFKEYTAKKLGVEKSIFKVVGPIIGVSGVLLGLGKRRGVTAVALLAETHLHPMYVGVTGARELIRVINTKYSYKINVTKLSQDVVALEQELLKRTQEWTSEMLSGSVPGAKHIDEDVTYIG
ncbi:PAC2 family protein [Candidatus Woesearchaeota archaeon]|nr:PAC2 family protein [Candidatus Woesearchaeota archaeon]